MHKLYNNSNYYRIIWRLSTIGCHIADIDLKCQQVFAVRPQLYSNERKQLITLKTVGLSSRLMSALGD